MKEAWRATLTVGPARACRVVKEDDTSSTPRSSDGSRERRMAFEMLRFPLQLHVTLLCLIEYSKIIIASTYCGNRALMSYTILEYGNASNPPASHPIALEQQMQSVCGDLCDIVSKLMARFVVGPRPSDYLIDRSDV